MATKPAQYSLIRQPAKHGATLSSDAVELSFHATLQVQESNAGTLTKYPVEASADEPRGEVASHFTNTPRTLTLQLVHSDTPNGATAATPAGLGEQMRAQLEALKESATLLTVTSGVRMYERMIITDISESRDQRTGQSYRPMVKFEAVRFASSNVVNIPLVGQLNDERTRDDVADSNGANDAASGESDTGRQTASEADDATRASLPPVARLLNLFGADI